MSEVKNETKAETKADLLAKNAELEAKLAAAEAKLSQKDAPVVPLTKPADPSENRPMIVELPYDGERYKDDLYVSINNKNWQIQRGKPVTVPFYVAEAIRESAEQDKATARMISIKEMEYQELYKSGNL